MRAQKRRDVVAPAIPCFWATDEIPRLRNVTATFAKSSFVFEFLRTDAIHAYTPRPNSGCSSRRRRRLPGAAHGTRRELITRASTYFTVCNRSQNEISKTRYSARVLVHGRDEVSVSFTRALVTVQRRHDVTGPGRYCRRVSRFIPVFIAISYRCLPPSPSGSVRRCLPRPPPCFPRRPKIIRRLSVPRGGGSAGVVLTRETLSVVGSGV